jgi:hypothetical protein
MKKISEEWLKAARDDLYVVEKIISDEGLTHMVAFHSQQCDVNAFSHFEYLNLDLIFSRTYFH